MKNRINRLPLLVILFILIGSIFRCWDFWTHNFCGDESAHMRKAVSVARGTTDLIKGVNRITGWQNLYLTILQHNHPPLEFLLLIPAVPFENREFSARFIYISLNIFFLIICYFISLKIYNQKFALYLLALLSTSTYFIWTSRFIIHDSLSIIASTLIGLSIIYLYKTDNLKKALIFLLVSFTLGLYSFIDFSLYLPVIIIILIDRFKDKNIKNFFKPLLIFFLINCLFYIPYIIYSFFPNVPRNAGFNYYLNSKIHVASINILKNLNIFYRDFLSRSGVFPIWLYALIGIFTLKKHKYIKYFTIIIFIFLIINLIKLTTLNFYEEFYGLIVIIATLWLISLGKLGKVLLYLAIILNLYGSFSILRNDFSSAIGPVIPSSDKLKIIGKIAKNCLTGNESYISTANPWRTFYYFGRPVLPAVEGGLWTATQAIELFNKGELRNEVFLIHYKKGEIATELESSLQKIAQKEYLLENDHMFVFKPCNY